MRQLRCEAYGENIDQHSWVTADELRDDIPWLTLSHSSRLLDLGCGPCGPLLFVIGTVGCHGTGIDASPAAIAAGDARAVSLGFGILVDLRVADINDPTPFSSAAFDAVMSIDVILHLRDRAAVFAEVARVLKPDGRFFFTDAGVITGAISDEEIFFRAIHGHTQFVPLGVNERALELAGFDLISARDRTANVVHNASGRLAARIAHRAELEQIEGHI